MPQSCRVRRLACAVAVSAAAIAWQAFATARAESTLAFDFASRNPLRYLGFGAQVWPQVGNVAARDAAIAALNIRHIRAALNTGISPALLQGHLSVEAIEALLVAQSGTPNVIASTAALQTLATEVGTYDLKLHYVHFTPPPAWTVPAFVWNGRQEYAINSLYLQDYANLIIAELRNAERNGVPIMLAEPANEPDGGWNAQFTPTQYDSFVAAVKAGLKAYGLGSIGIEGPGTSTATTAGPYLTQMASDGTLAAVAAVSVHDYDVAPLPTVAGLSGLGAAPGSFRKRFFVTELGNNSATWSAAPYTSPPTSVSGTSPAVWSTNFAVAEIAEALQCLGAGASSPLLWQLQDMYWDPSDWGLLDVHGNWKPTAQAAAAILGRLPPGSITVAGRSSVAGLTGTAFVANGSTLLAISNLTTADLTLKATLSHFPTWTKLAVQGVYPPGAQIGPLLAGGTSATMTVPAASVVLLDASR